MSITLARTLRTDRPHRVRRVLVGVVSTAVATAGLAVAGTPAQAAEAFVAPSLTWKVSEYIANPAGQFADHTTTGGATETDRVVTFPNGVGSYNPTTGVTSVKYSGTLKASGQGNAYSVTFADPTVTVDAVGEGTVSADVSWAVAPSSTAGPTRVTVTRFDAQTSDWTTDGSLPSLTKTPKWVGVLQPNTPESAAAGITNTTRPVNGESFAPEFITFLNPQIKAFFYSTGTNPTSDALKAPAAFTAQAPVATITSTEITEQAATSLKVSVAGSGYFPGGNGIYVAVGESGLLPTAAASSYLGAVSSTSPTNPEAAVKADGTFTALLKLTKAEVASLDPAKSYSVYTIKAHGGNITDPSQSDSVPLAIDFAGFTKKSSTPTVVAPSSVYGRGSTVTVSVPAVGLGAVAPTGSVVLTGADSQAAVLVNGSATFTLPARLTAGSTTLTASYSGDDNYAASTVSGTKTVTAAKVSIKRGSTKKPTTKKTGKSTLTLKSVTGAPVDGKAKVSFTKKGQATKVKTVMIKAGKGNITIPKLAKGRWTVSVKYSGTPNFVKTATLKRGSFTVTK